MSSPVYTWKDVVLIRGKCYGETFEISGETDLLDGRIYYQIDDFMMAVSVKYDIDVDDIETYMMDNIEFDPTEIGFGAEDCGVTLTEFPNGQMVIRNIHTTPCLKHIKHFSTPRKMSWQSQWKKPSDILERHYNK